MYLVVLLLVRTPLQAGECVSVERISTESTTAGIPRQAASQDRLRREDRPRLEPQQVSVQAEGAKIQEGTQRLHFYVYEESIQTVQVRCLLVQDTRCTSGRRESCSCRSVGAGKEGKALKIRPLKDWTKILTPTAFLPDALVGIMCVLIAMYALYVCC